MDYKCSIQVSQNWKLKYRTHHLFLYVLLVKSYSAKKLLLYLSMKYTKGQTYMKICKSILCILMSCTCCNEHKCTRIYVCTALVLTSMIIRKVGENDEQLISPDVSGYHGERERERSVLLRSVLPVSSSDRTLYLIKSARPAAGDNDMVVRVSMCTVEVLETNTIHRKHSDQIPSIRCVCSAKLMLKAKNWCDFSFFLLSNAVRWRTE